MKTPNKRSTIEYCLDYVDWYEHKYKIQKEIARKIEAYERKWKPFFDQMKIYADKS